MYCKNVDSLVRIMNRRVDSAFGGQKLPKIACHIVIATRGQSGNKYVQKENMPFVLEVVRSNKYDD